MDVREQLEAVRRKLFQEKVANCRRWLVVFNKEEYYRFITRPFLSSWKRDPQQEEWRRFRQRWPMPERYPALVTMTVPGGWEPEQPNLFYDNDLIEGARL